VASGVGSTAPLASRARGPVPARPGRRQREADVQGPLHARSQGTSRAGRPLMPSTHSRPRRRRAAMLAVTAAADPEHPAGPGQPGAGGHGQPMGPTPATVTSSPMARPARRTARTATASGSAKASRRRSASSGTGTIQSAGAATCSAAPPGPSMPSRRRLAQVWGGRRGTAGRCRRAVAGRPPPGPGGQPGGASVQAAGDLVAEHDVRLGPGVLAGADVQVGAAQAAVGDLDQDLAVAGPGPGGAPRR
jgi:hypothetical protein